MNVAFACPKCEQTTQVDFDESVTSLSCRHCGHSVATAPGAAGGNSIQRCLVCGGEELFVRKNFSQRLGVTIVVIGFVASSVTWYYHQIYATFAILFATALIDVLLFALVGNLLQCYRCRSEYRGVEQLEQHQPFSLEVHERHRQQAARMSDL